MTETEQPIYSIGAVARMVNVPVESLRTWEARYRLIVPIRSAGGQRLFTRDQVEQLRFVASQIDEGVSPATAHRLLADRLAHPPAPGLGGVRIAPRLLVMLLEHDPYAAALEEYFLRTEGFDVTLVLDEDDSFERATPRPDLVVLELMIRGGRGLELIGRLKERTGARVLALSILEAREQAFAAGADAFVRKPLDPLQLVSAVKDLLGSSAFLARGSGPAS
jgi:DNA-binding transcriptional MerR regulator